MAGKKLKKFLIGSALIGAAIAGGIAYLTKFKDDDLEDEFDDFDDDFEEDLEDDTDSKREYVSIDIDAVDEAATTETE